MFFPFLWLSAPSIPPKIFTIRLSFEISVEGQKWEANYVMLNIERKMGKLQIAVTDGSEREVTPSLQGSTDT